MKRLILIRSNWSCLCIALCCSVVSSLACAESNNSDSSSKVSSKKLDEVSIIGNRELPQVEFVVPWGLPSVPERADQKPLAKLENMLAPLEPVVHRKRIFFSQHLEVQSPKLMQNR